MADYTITNHGTLFLVRPNNVGAQSHLSEVAPEEAQFWGTAIVVEHRYAFDFAQALIADGFTVE